MSSGNFVFLDPTGKRWPRWRFAVAIIVFTIGLGVFVFIRTLLQSPPLPANVLELKRQIRAEQKANPFAQTKAPSAVAVIPASATANLRLLSGKTVTVRGEVVAVDKSQPENLTSLVLSMNPEGATVAIFKANYDHFPLGFDAFKGDTVLVRGLLVLTAGGRPQIVIESPQQITVVDQDSWQSYYEENQQRLGALAASHKPRTAAVFDSGQIRAAFYPDSDEQSFRSLTAHASRLTHVCPEAMRMTGVDGSLQVSRDSRLEKFAALSGLKLVPQLTNMGDQGWEPEGVEYLAFGPAAHRADFIRQLRGELAGMGASGVLIDWEEVDPAYRDQYTELFREIASGLHSDKRELWVSISVGDEMDKFDLSALTGIADRLVAVLRDENAEEDAPGPVASQDWFEGWLKVLTAYGDPSRWIVDVATYGYDWADGQSTAQTISFADAMSRARYAGSTSVGVHPPQFSPTFAYTDSGVEHTVWFSDAVTFLNELRAANDRGVGGFLMTSLGGEDPRTWDAFDVAATKQPSPADFAPLTLIPADPVVTNLGKGEMVWVDDRQEDGSRTVAMRPDGRVAEDYRDFPAYPTLYHTGAGDGREVALTFDDGPDPEWTPKILDVLRQWHVHATFFLIGENAEQYPELVRRILAEGHEIGSHTYTHPNLALVSTEQVKLELNATQRLIEGITGRSTTLFRPPYDADSSPTDAGQLAPLQIADDMNYLTVLEAIDPQDWAKPGADEIVNGVRDQITRGSIVLLHDGGGDRSQTVEALPKILEYLRERGSRVVSLHKLMGTTADALMPPLPRTQRTFDDMASALGFGVIYWVERAFWSFLAAAVVLVLARTIIVLTLAVWHRRNSRGESVGTLSPAISVLIPAYNEERVIAATIRSVLATNYPGLLEVIVIDDGSRDETSRAASSVDPGVRVLAQVNQGKAAALERGMLAAAHDIVVLIDADTRIEPDAFLPLVQPFADPGVGAVSGHARVGNRRTFLARCQDLEYICGFNLDRRAYALWNAITVAPGAISAFRRDAILAAGGFSRDTLAEDTDLTLAVHQAGFRVAYAPSAVAWTEAPETVSTLAKQRFRWAFGTLQSIWKHRRLLGSSRHPGLGWFSLPSIWLFQLGLVAVAPLIDGLCLYALFIGRGMDIFPYFAAFLAAELVLAAGACAMEGEPLRAAWRIVPMRFVYRPLLSYVVWKAVLRAIRGAWVGWGKLDRTASVPEVA
ncbi:MAG: glycosyltransferase [Chthoniobacterales bacterium]